MKKLLLLFNFTFCILHFAYSQNPLVKIWDKRFGGTEWDWLTSFQQTREGGFIMGGYSNSTIGGDKTQDTVGNCDYWVVKINSQGNKEWDKNFGGNMEDKLYALQQTIDGGYILGGTSRSGIGGDKTQNCQDTSNNFYLQGDYWIVKLDSLGNKQWDKDFGGMEWEEMYAIQQTSDGGFILGGLARSGIGGNKTQANWDTSGNSPDYWIVKTDSLGNLQWDMTIGGTNGEVLRSIQQTIDSGFIIGGYSVSGIGGNKTQPIWGIPNTYYDFWIVKTDFLGNIQWDKDFGGMDDDRLYSLKQCSDGGYFLGGLSRSGVGGDKSLPTWGPYPDQDYWVIKIDSLGNKLWEKDFGGSGLEDEFGNVSLTADGGYLIAGTSYSQLSGDKSENNLGFEQSWILKTDSIGNKKWDKTLFTNAHDETGLAFQTTDGCYAFANLTHGSIAGDKTEMGRGYEDYWIVKFCDNIPTAAAHAPSLFCPGSCIDFLNLSLNAISYQWSFPGGIPDSSTAINPTNICYANPGTYDVQLIATNANGSDTLQLNNYITVYPSPSAQSISQIGDTLFAITGSNSYQWYYNGNLITGATNYFYIASESGDYNVVASDTNGCEVEAVLNDVIAGLTPALSKGEGVVVFPNPVVETLFVIGYSLSGTAVEILFYNMLGEKINLTVNRGLSTVDCQLLLPGLYWLEVSSPEKIYRAKFMKQ